MPSQDDDMASKIAEFMALDVEERTEFLHGALMASSMVDAAILKTIKLQSDRIIHVHKRLDTHNNVIQVMSSTITKMAELTEVQGILIENLTERIAELEKGRLLTVQGHAN